MIVPSMAPKWMKAPRPEKRWQSAQAAAVQNRNRMPPSTASSLPKADRQSQS